MSKWKLCIPRGCRLAGPQPGSCSLCLCQQTWEEAAGGVHQCCPSGMSENTWCHLQISSSYIACFHWKHRAGYPSCCFRVKSAWDTWWDASPPYRLHLSVIQTVVKKVSSVPCLCLNSSLLCVCIREGCISVQISCRSLEIACRMKEPRFFNYDMLITL